MAATFDCAGCGAANAADQRFCGTCGASLAQRCSACARDNDPGFRFCGSCGAPLVATPAAPVPVETRRWVSVLFADLSGFTRASETMDPEDVRTLVDGCMARLGEVVEHHGGYVEKIIGDQIMVLFGAPISHEDDAERAVRTGLEMQRCAAELTDVLAGLRLRVGINTGEVMFAPVGPEGARRFTVMGDAVNTASRLETACPIGRVLVGAETVHACRDAILFEEVDPVRAKNKSEPVPAWLALEAFKESTRKVSGVPLVGRSEELARLRSVWGRVVEDRRPHIVTLVGPAGIGKTRVVNELLEDLGPQVRVLSGRSVPYGESVGYGAFAHQTKAFAGIYDVDDERAAVKLEAAVLRVVPDHDVAAHIALLLGLSHSKLGDKASLFLAARRFVEGIAREAPTVMVFEDLHNGAASLHDLVESLAARASDAPLLLLCVTRPELYESRPLWGGGLRAATTVELEALSAEESLTLATSLVGEHPALGADVDIARITDLADGNPFYLEEIVAWLGEGPQEHARELPRSLRALTAARLDTLPPEARALLADAAVAGRSFSRALLETLHGERCTAVLDLLHDRQLVRFGGGPGGDEVSFRHALTREVAYAMLPRAVRRERHAVIARAIEDRAGTLAVHSALLAHHYREAGDAERAVVHLVAAAGMAERAWAKHEAIRLFNEALELIPTDDVEQRNRVRITKGRLYADAGELAKAVAELEPLLPELSGVDLTRALLICARAVFWQANAPAARGYADEAVAVARSTGDVEVLGPALGIRMLTTSLAGTLEDGIEMGHEALVLLDAGAHTAERVLVTSHIGLHHYWLGVPAEAERWCRAAAEAGAAAHDLDGALGGGAQLAMALASLGRIEEALTVFADVRARADEVELFPRHAGRATSMWAGTLRELQDLDGARRLNEEALDLGRRAAFLNTQVQAAVDLLVLDLAAGDVGTVASQIDRVAGHAAALKGWHEWLVSIRLADLRAALELARGDDEAAAAAAGTSVAKAAQHGRLKYRASGERMLADALSGLGRHDDAFRHARRALEHATRSTHPPAIWVAAATVRRTAATIGSDDVAAAAHGEAVAAIDRWAAGMNDRHRAVFLEAEAIRSIRA